MKRIRVEIEVCGMRFVQSDEIDCRYAGAAFNLYQHYEGDWSVETKGGDDLAIGETPEKAMLAALRRCGPAVDALRALDLEGAS